ncbi:FAD dependent oxidoreductase [Leucosporidium creatinivorum]|uniref:FAD dependent oxidoreductase n=1 Tax=Leucosporidium creatinivorum TaxID=106004 RepID=A0A1Y2FJI7_9BASI|nr:FAD dependent oxidoreductase [Leucosporidium creatinivorum]
MTSVLIVGAGEFGCSTAISLLKSGRYSSVTILDRAEVLPAEDAASTDISKVVRYDYSDPDYSRLAKEAITRWTQDFPDVYHESGVVVLGLEGDSVDSVVARQSLANVQAQADNITVLQTPESIKNFLRAEGRADVPIADIADSAMAYHNPTGGWAEAGRAVEKLLERIKELGGKIVPGASLAALLYTDDGKDVRGVRTQDGKEFLADKVIIATGSWTPSIPALKGLLPSGLITATGQTIACIQLTEELRKKYEHIPVTMNLGGSGSGGGFYSFPPTANGLLKCAFHAAGFTSEDGVPKTTLDAAAVEEREEKGLAWIPRASLDALRHSLGLQYPELAALPFTFTRMCWYSDVVDGDWIIDYHPQYPSLLYASGGAGHAFKFLPIIGELIHARLENTLPENLKQKWSLSRPTSAIDPARIGMQRKPLVVDELATREDMAKV